MTDAPKGWLNKVPGRDRPDLYWKALTALLILGALVFALR